MKLGVHGGDTLTYKDYYDGDLLDFSSNINPLGYPPKLEEGLKKSIDQLLTYPDIYYRDLKANISAYMELSEENIVVGNGATELIDWLISLFKRVILVQPAFAEYELRAQVHGLDIVYIDLNKDMTLDIGLIKEVSQEGDLVFLTNPHNPSGMCLTKEDLVDLYMDLLEKNAYLGLDEAFFEFADLNYDSLKIFRDLDFANIGVIRAATKFFGVPGLRLGYGAFSKDMVARLEEVIPPWSVNSFAVEASNYLFDQDYIRASRDFIFEERRAYIRALASIKGVSPYPSQSNYVLLKIQGQSEDKVFYGLLQRGILVRRCSNFKNLDGTHIRVAIKSSQDNDKLVQGLKEIMEEEDGIFI